MNRDDSSFNADMKMLCLWYKEPNSMQQKGNKQGLPRKRNSLEMCEIYNVYYRKNIGSGWEGGSTSR